MLSAMQAIQFELFKTYAKAEVLISVIISCCRASVGNNEGSLSHSLSTRLIVILCHVSVTFNELDT